MLSVLRGRCGAINSVKSNASQVFTDHACSYLKWTNEDLVKYSYFEFNEWSVFGQMFDRDEPSREKEMYLTVRATDNGNPQLDDVCTIKVTIDDINDNSPVFDKVVSSHLAYSQKLLGNKFLYIC